MDKAANLTGKMLIAMPGIGDPRFERALVLICAHDEGHAMGIAVNRPVEGLTLPDLLGRLDVKPSIEIPAELVLLAMGFVGPEKAGLVEQLGVDLDPRGNVARDENYATSVPGVFVCGDAGRGQSLIVWAIAEGRSCANGVDAYLQGKSRLPKPILPTERPMMV